MDETPFISICIPAFQRVNYLRRLLDSIEIQSFRDFETVISDDSPGPEVQELIRSHPLNPKIRYIKNRETLGSPENWNEGIRHAKADWIKIMHDDDWFSGPDCLLIFKKAIENGKADFYFSSYTNVFQNGHFEKVRFNKKRLKRLIKLPEILFAVNRIGPPSVVIFKKDISIVFDSRMQWLVDIDFYISYINKHPTIAFIPDYLVQIGLSESQITQRSYGQRQIEFPERLILQEKMGSSSLNSIQIYDSWWRIIRNYDIKNQNEIKEYAFNGKIPEEIIRIIHFQRHLPSFVLKIGFFSKILMSIHFFFICLNRGKYL